MDFKILSRSYDFRWIYGEEFVDADFEILGRAFALWTTSKKIVIGYDARLASESLASAFERGVFSAGKDVIWLGRVSSDMLQFSTLVWEDAEFAVMITASHSPKEYNGFKVCGKNVEPINLKLVGREITHIIETIASEQRMETSGVREERDILPIWIEKVATFARGDFSHLKVVADAGNWVAGIFMPALAERLGFTLIPLFFEPDGNFPNHHPSPIESKNMQDLVKKVQEVGADIGVAFDGDADRAIMCDEKGVIIKSSITLAAIAELFLREQPGKKIIHNTTTSDIVSDTVKALGGTPVRERVGNVYIKEHMNMDPEIIFAGESSSHYFFRELRNMDSWVIAFVMLLRYLYEFELTASGVSEKFDTYENIEETNFRVTDAKMVMESLSLDYNMGMQDWFDGLTVRFSDWWFNVRPAANDPVLRLNIEVRKSATNIQLDEKFEEIASKIKRFAP